jgi:Ras-related protein Rab-2A
VYDVTSRKSRWNLDLAHTKANNHLLFSAGFLNCQNWLKDVREHADPNLTCILVGNKVDLCESAASDPSSATGGRTSIDQPRSATLSGTSPRKAGTGSIRSSTTRSAKQRTREVPTDEAEKWAKEEGLLFVEASAKSGHNVELAFIEACKDILKKINKGAFDDDRVCVFFVFIFRWLALIKCV